VVGGRDPRAARTLGLWTASWLAGLLLAGLLWVGEPTVQWPVLLVPALWALFSVRPRRRDTARPRGWDVVPAPGRTDTVERPIVRQRPEWRRGPD
jgi:hypothetical protein